MVAALYNWDPTLQVYTLGDIPSSSPKTPRTAAKWMGECNGGDIAAGGYGCGSFSEGTVIYKCVGSDEDGYWLKKHEVCAWVSSAGGQCVKNQLKKGAKFYPFVSGGKVVCVQPVAVFGHS